VSYRHCEGDVPELDRSKKTEAKKQKQKNRLRQGGVELIGFITIFGQISAAIANWERPSHDVPECCRSVLSESVAVSDFAVDKECSLLSAKCSLDVLFEGSLGFEGKINYLAGPWAQVPVFLVPRKLYLRGGGLQRIGDEVKSINHFDAISWRLARVFNEDNGSRHIIKGVNDASLYGENVSPQLSFAGFFLRDKSFFKSNVRAMENAGLDSNPDRSQNNEQKGKIISKSFASVLSFFLLSISLLLMAVCTNKSRDSKYAILYAIAAWPAMFAAVWMLLTGVLDWHLSASFNRRSENIVIKPIIVPELKLRNVKMQVFLADVMECAAAANGLLRGTCHRARIRATRWLAMTAVG
jgi:hypothetical protein